MNFLENYKQKDLTSLIIILGILLFNPLTLFYIFYPLIVLDHKLTFGTISYSFSDWLQVLTPQILWILLILGFFGIIFRKTWGLYIAIMCCLFITMAAIYSFAIGNFHIFFPY